MQKTRSGQFPVSIRALLQLFFFMKLTILLILLTAMQVSARVHAQQRFTINMQQTSVDKIFTAIQKESHYRFFYNYAFIKKLGKVNLSVENASLKDVLAALLNGRLSYRIIDPDMVVITDLLEADAGAESDANTEIHGSVFSEKGDPLTGVSVKVKGTKIGTLTNEKGDFTLSAAADAVLEISYVGYEVQETSVQDKRDIRIQLKPLATGLNEVVVVGYGTQKKANLTGATATISGDVLDNRTITNVGRGLMGQVAGLNITTSSGQPGLGTKFNIRGFTSINSGDPYILVDNVPVADVNTINPDDIASITVLKDAASSAVYGSRAPFGVILIVTRKGKNGSLRVNYSNNFAMHSITHLPDVVTDPYTVMSMKNESYRGYYGTDLYSQAEMDYAKKRSADPTLPATILNPNNNTLYDYFSATNWFKELYKPHNFSNNNTVSVSGGGDKITYYLSGGYNRQTGVYRYNPDVYKRYNFRGKLDFTANKWLSLSNYTVYNHTGYDYPSLWTSDWTSGDLYHEIGRRPSLSVLKNPDGSWTSDGVDIGFLQQGGRGNTTTGELQNTTGLTISLFNNSWHIRADYTFRNTNDYSRQFHVAMPYEKGPDQTVYYAGHSDASNWSDNISYQNLNLYTDYEKTFGGKHYFKALAGFNQEQNNYDYFSAQNNQLISSNVGYLDGATGTTPSVAGNAYSWAVRGLFYRVNYAYANRYLVELDGRYDGSSRFPKNNQYVFFPSASAGWRISEEAFFQPLKKVVNELKVRASYGSLGNQNTYYAGTSTPDYYPYIPRLSSGQISNILGGVQPIAVYAPNLVSPTLKWEQVYTRNLGVDLSLLKKLDIGFDIYRRDTKNMLSKSAQLPATLGASQPLENAADLKTNGWELSMQYNDQFRLAGKPFKYTVRVNVWDNRTVITRYNNANQYWFGGDYYVGQHVGDIWGLTTLGIFQTNEEAKKWADQTQVIGYYGQQAGELKYADLNGDGKINYGDGTVKNPGDAHIIGNTTPRYSFGVGGNFSWNNIDLYVYFQGIGKADFWPGTSGYYWSQFYSPWDNVYQNIVGNTWTPQNPNAFYPSLKGWRAGDAGAWKDLAVPQTRYLYSAAYIRLKTLSIGYSIAPAALHKIGIDQVRFYVSGEDLWESTKLPKAFDPEGLSGSWGAGKVYPFQRGYSIGMNVKF